MDGGKGARKGCVFAFEQLLPTVMVNMDTD